MPRVLRIASSRFMDSTERRAPIGSMCQPSPGRHTIRNTDKAVALLPPITLRSLQKPIGSNMGRPVPKRGLEAAPSPRLVGIAVPSIRIREAMRPVPLQAIIICR